MSLSTWLANAVRAVDTEYDRRIRRASNVVAYDAGDGHSDDANGDSTQSVTAVVHTSTEETYEDEGFEIVNVPRGTRLSPVRIPVAMPQDEVLVGSE